MKEHQSRKFKVGENYYFLDPYSRIEEKIQGLSMLDYTKYLDSNNLLHSLDVKANGAFYWIHGKRYMDKNDWEIEVNRILMLSEL